MAQHIKKQTLWCGEDQEMTWDICNISCWCSFTNSPCNKYLTDKNLRVQTPSIQPWTKSLSWSVQQGFWTNSSGICFLIWISCVQATQKSVKKQARWSLDKTKNLDQNKKQHVIWSSKRFPLNKNKSEGYAVICYPLWEPTQKSCHIRSATPTAKFLTPENGEDFSFPSQDLLLVSGQPNGISTTNGPIKRLGSQLMSGRCTWSFEKTFSSVPFRQLF